MLEKSFDWVLGLAALHVAVAVFVLPAHGGEN